MRLENQADLITFYFESRNLLDRIKSKLTFCGPTNFPQTCLAGSILFLVYGRFLSAKTEFNSFGCKFPKTPPSF